MWKCGGCILHNCIHLFVIDIYKIAFQHTKTFSEAKGT